MAKPRVFVSSTFYDLKHVRASMDLFVRSLGFESVLSEKGDIAYSFERPLDESCFAEVGAADIFVLVVGGRYGTAASDQNQAASPTFFERYESITKREYERAIELDLPVYILIEKAVDAEYQTFRLNRDSTAVTYAHVDSVNVFLLIEEILARPRNNPIFTFERFTEIEEWLREQWAGLFRDLLKRAGQQSQLRALSEQVAEMREINETLKNYLEAVVTSVVPERSSQLIHAESKRLTDRRILRQAADQEVVRFLSAEGNLPESDVVQLIDEARSSADLRTRLLSASPVPGFDETLDSVFLGVQFVSDLNSVRQILGRPTSFRRIRPLGLR